MTLWLILFTPSAAQAAPTFRELAFPPGPRITDRIAVDLDHDGAKDLIIVRGREVSIYLQRGGGFTPDRPSQRFNFLDQAILWDMGDVDGDGRDEMLFLTSEGVSYYAWTGERLSFVPHELLKTDSILKTASATEVRWKHFYEDLDGDGVPDLILPGDSAFIFHRGLGKGKFAPGQRLEMRPDVFIDGGGDTPTSQMTSSWWYPQAYSGDWDGDGKRDIFVYQHQLLTIFMGRAGGEYGPEPTLALPLKFTGPLDEGRFKLDYELPMKFADVDGDGRTDVVATHIGRATTYVFKGAKGRDNLGTPDSILKFQGITFLNFLVDLDHDGRMDLVLGRTDRPGVLDLVKVLITKEVPVEVLFFFGRPGAQPYPKEPDYRREIDIPILFSSARRGVNIGTSAVLSLLGDFDGDGRNDMLLRSSATKIAVYTGKGRSFSDEPAFEIPVRSMDGYRFLEPVAEDIDGDGIADLMLTYYSWDGKEDQLSLLLSSGVRRAPAGSGGGGG